MAFSEGYGIGSLKPGVCTSTSRPSSPYDGQVIYETDTDRCLVWNSTGWVQLSTGTTNPPGLEYITSSTFTSQTSVSVNNCFTSVYDSYKVTLSDLTSSSAGIVQLWIRLRLSGTDASGASDYKTQFWRLYGLATAANAGSTGQNVASLGYISTGGKANYTMDFINPAKAVSTTHLFQGHAYQSDIATYIAIVGSNTHTVNTAYDGFTLSSDSGNLTGTIRVYGYRNS